MRKTISILFSFAFNLSAMAQDQTCLLAVAPIKIKELTEAELGLIQDKGYSFADRRREANFLLEVTMLPSGMVARGSITHRSGLKKEIPYQRVQAGVLDPRRSEMAQELHQAQTISAYQEILSKWENYEFQDIRGMSAREAVFAQIPYCTSFYP